MFDWRVHAARIPDLGRTARETVAFAICSICVILMAGTAASADLPESGELSGIWSGIAEHNEQSTAVVLRFAPSDTGMATASLWLPAMHLWDYFLGPIALQDSVLEAGPFRLHWDPVDHALSGTLPRALVPVYTIPFTLHRTETPPDTSRVQPTAPTIAPVWTFSAGAAIWADLAYADGLVYAGGDDGRLHALDARSGRERWTFQAAGAIRARAAIRGHDVFVPADDGFLYRLDAKTGKESWKVRIADEPIVRLPNTDPKTKNDLHASGATLADGRLYLGTHDGRVLALNAADGSEVWTFHTGGSVLATPAVQDGRVYAGSYDGHVYAIDVSTGSQVWCYDTAAPVTSTPAPSRGVVIIGTRGYDLFGLDAASGSVLWNRYVWFSWIESSALVKDGIAYVGSSDAATLYAVETASGRTVWEADMHGLAWGQPALGGDRVFLGTRGVPGPIDHTGSAQARERSSGHLLWQFPIARPRDGGAYGFEAAPALGDGLVFFATIEGRVLAFRADGG